MLRTICISSGRDLWGIHHSSRSRGYWVLLLDCGGRKDVGVGKAVPGLTCFQVPTFRPLSEARGLILRRSSLTCTGFFMISTIPQYTICTQTHRRSVHTYGKSLFGTHIQGGCARCRQIVVVVISGPSAWWVGKCRVDRQEGSSQVAGRGELYGDIETRCLHEDNTIV